MSLRLIITCLAFSLAAAQHSSGEAQRIAINARGNAQYSRNDVDVPDRQETAASSRHVKALVEGDVSGSILGDKQEYVQLVNGSTPTGWMELGTPPKKLLVIFDTGSDKLVAKTWDTLSNELASIDQGVQGAVKATDKIYDHDTSSTYQVKTMMDPVTGEMVPAKNQIAYGSGMAITDEGNDTVKMGPFMLKNFSLSEITADSLQLLHTSKGISGVLGLQHMKNRSLGRSLFSRFRDAGLLTSFGYCRGTGDNGTFIWGDKSSEGDELPVLGEMHWAVALGSVKMNGTGDAPAPVAAGGDGGDGKTTVVHIAGRMGGDADPSGAGDAPADANTDALRQPGGDGMGGDAPPAEAGDGEGEGEGEGEGGPAVSVDANGKGPLPCVDNKCCGIFDTGSNIIAGPTAVMKALTTQARVAPDCSNFDSLPLITLNFGGKEVTVHPEGYVMKVPMPSWSSMGGGGGGPMGGDGAGGDGPGGDGAGGAGGGAGDGAGDGAGGGAGLEQTAARQLAKTRGKMTWKAAFEHLRKHRGIDLSAAMHDDLTKSINNNFNSTDDNATAPQFLCMPALVPIDKHTKYGPLYIVGTPLLQTHYARWSYGSADTSPKIFIKRLSDSNTCKTVQPDPSQIKGSSLEASSMMRSEQRTKHTSTATHRSRGPMIRNIEDISFPHWAKHIEHV